MNISPVDHGGDLDAGQELEFQRRRNVRRRGHASHRVVVGHRQRPNSGAVCPLDEGGWIKRSVGRGGVQVQVDQSDSRLVFEVAVWGTRLAGRRRAVGFD